MLKHIHRDTDKDTASTPVYLTGEKNESYNWNLLIMQLCIYFTILENTSKNVPVYSLSPLLSGLSIYVALLVKNQMASHIPSEGPNLLHTAVCTEAEETGVYSCIGFKWYSFGSSR